jgi:hypothetical protein
MKRIGRKDLSYDDFSIRWTLEGIQLYVSLDQQWNNSSCSGHIVCFQGEILDKDGEISEMSDTQIEDLIDTSFEINYHLQEIHLEIVYSA